MSVGKRDERVGASNSTATMSAVTFLGGAPLLLGSAARAGLRASGETPCCRPWKDVTE